MKDQIERAIDLVIEQDNFLIFLKDGNRIDNYTVRPNGIIDVEGDVNLNNMNLTKIPVKFGIAAGWFDCSDNQLTSLEGAPEKVGEWFDCSFNQLISLQGAPEEVGGWFDCSDNQLTSLEGCPEEVGGSFDCSYNKLTTLRGCPKKVEGGYICDNNPVEFTKEDIELAKQGKAPLGLPLSFVLMKNKEKTAMRKKK